MDTTLGRCSSAQYSQYSACNADSLKPSPSKAPAVEPPGGQRAAGHCAPVTCPQLLCWSVASVTRPSTLASCDPERHCPAHRIIYRKALRPPWGLPRARLFCCRSSFPLEVLVSSSETWREGKREATLQALGRPPRAGTMRDTESRLAQRRRWRHRHWGPDGGSADVPAGGPAVSGSHWEPRGSRASLGAWYPC